MYLPPDAPLPPNSRNPSMPGLNGRGTAANIEAAALEGRQRVQQLPTPDSFLGIGLPLTVGVVQAQRRMAAANNPYNFPQRSAASVIANAPKVLPLNVSVQEYNGCCTPIYSPTADQTQAAPLVRPNVPQAPICVETPSGTVYVQTSTAPYAGPGSAPGSGMGVSCNRGMGAAWGDVGLAPCGPTWGRKPQSPVGGLLVLMAIGLVMFTDFK